MTGKSSPSTPIPLKMLGPGEAQQNPNHNGKRELQIAPTTPFTLPDDWFVEEKPRPFTATSPGRVDKYYYEPGTGRKFRSLTAVERYLTEEKQATSIPETMKPENEDSMQTVAHTIKSRSPFKLPDDWIIAVKPRSNIKYTGVTDKYYIEPGSGQRFRSLKAVERYLTEENKNMATPNELEPSNHLTLSRNSGSQKKVGSKYPIDAEEDNITLKALKLANCSTPPKTSGSCKESISAEKANTSMLGIGSPPAKIKWVLAGSGGNIWSPFVDESMVTESVKQKWSKKFKSVIPDRNFCAPSFSVNY